jgi:hypothetical protein
VGQIYIKHSSLLKEKRIFEVTIEFLEVRGVTLFRDKAKASL